MTLNPEILRWARSTAGLSADDAARALGFSDTRVRSATERLDALEAGREEPTRSVLLRMAKTYRRSLLVFYLANPPRTGDRGSDFRAVPGGARPSFNPILDALIRDVRARQGLVKSLLEEAESEPVDFVGTASLKEPVEALSRRIQDRLGFSLEEFRRQPRTEDAFRYLRAKAESAGVFVLLLGNLGSHHTNISADVFRGLVISDQIAPFVVINDQDARPTWAFTLVHEMAHLWLGTTGISGTNIEGRIERYCNAVAGEFLLPTAEIQRKRSLHTESVATVIQVLSEFAAELKVSRAMVAYRFFLANLISDTTWRTIADHFRQEWIAGQKKREDAEVDDDGSRGPSYYVVKRHRLGEALLDMVRRSIGEGILTHTKAAQILGVKPRNVEPLLHGTASETKGR